MALEERLKQRMLGGAVLVALVVIFVPMLIEEPVEQQDRSAHTIPVKPQPQNHQQVSRAAAEKHKENRVDEAAIKRNVVKQVAVESEPEQNQAVTSKPEKRDETKKPTDTDKRPTPTAWIIQVASLTNESNATKLVEKLRKAELPAQMAPVKLDGKQHYRVRVGPEVDHRLAKKMVAKIKKNFKLDPTLMRYPQ
jgi:DedD protein